MRAYTIAVAGLLVGASSYPSTSSQLDHLDGRNSFGVEVPYTGCRGDRFRLGDAPAIVATMRRLNIPASKVSFVSCDTGEFATFPDLDTAEDAYLIKYPLGLKDRDAYSAPIIHELAHVFQSREAGSMGALKIKYELRQIELGADFLAGVVLQSGIVSVKLREFQTSLALIGSYHEEKEDHGLPMDRAAAVRNGYFIDERKFNSNIALMENEFNRNRYRSIIVNDRD